MSKASVLSAVVGLAAALPVRAEEFTLDSFHTKAGFSVRHMMVTTVRGQFGNVTGTVHYDPRNLGATVIDATIDATTIDTQEPKRDAHLRSADFFDVDKFKTIAFKSRNVSRADDGMLSVTGDLTMHGVTKPVELRVDGPTPAVKDLYGNLKIGATATAKVNRHDFGLNWNKALEAGGVLVGDEVTITIDIEARQTK